MCEALENDGLPMPKYTVHPGDIMILFTSPEDRIIRFTDKVNVHLAEKETQILNYLNQNPGYTVTALSELMGISRKSVAGYLKNLKDKGIIERVEFSRKGYWIINL